MAKRHTTIRLSALTDAQIEYLSAKWTMTKTEVIAISVDRIAREIGWRETAQDTSEEAQTVSARMGQESPPSSLVG